MIKACLICGAQFDAPPSGRKTCSEACYAVLRSKSHVGVRNTWNEASRAKLRSKPVPPQLAKGFEAAMRLPESQRGEQHRESMIWHLVDPSGNKLTVVNLTEWARNNLQLFGETDETGVNRITSGFQQIAQSMRGKLKRSVYHYKGWGLSDVPATVDRPKK